MNYQELVKKVIAENNEVLMRVDPKEVDTLIDYICKAKQIQIFSMGRCQLSVRGFAMRLAHMGFPTHVVFDTVTPAIGPGDLLIGHCSANNVELNVIQQAKKAGAKIVIITPCLDTPQAKLADFIVNLPGQIFGGANEVASIQPMASLLEQALLLFTDIVVMMLIEKKKISMKEMQLRHTNLEGLPHEFA